jgi:hypothetical protein
MKMAFLSAPAVAAAFLLFHGFAHAADVRQAKQLPDSALDKISAGALAYAAGDSSAKGALAFTDARTTIDVRPDAQTTVSGHARAVGTANANFSASASSSLQLSYSSLGGTR